MHERDKNNTKNRRDRGRKRVRIKLTPVVIARLREFAMAGISPARQQYTNVYYDPNVLERGDSVGPPYARVTVDRPSVLVFIDDVPIANFGHPCRYVFHDPRTGVPLRHVRTLFPPHPLRGLRTLEPLWTPIRRRERRVEPHPAVQRVRMAKRKKKKTAAKTAGGGRRFAILYAGDAEEVHVNDFELSYRMLHDVYGYPDGNIFVLIHDGKRSKEGPFYDRYGNKRMWPPDAKPQDQENFRIPLHGPGTQDAFRDVLALLNSKNLGPNDTLFIHTEGHGGPSDGVSDDTVFLGDIPSDPFDAKYCARDFARDLGTLNPCKSLLVLMNQCYAGGFSQPILMRSRAAVTSVACAAEVSEIAYGAYDLNLDWCDFSLDWMEAQMHEHFDHTSLSSPPQTKPNGSVSALEAFKYAKTNTEGNDTPNIKPTQPSPADDISLI
jgi:peptidase C13-like protein